MKIRLLALFCCTLSLFSPAQWVELFPTYENKLFDVFAITPEIVVAIGGNGTILRTTDGGNHWDYIASETQSHLYEIEFPTNEVGYIVGDNILLKSIDSGATWSEIVVPNTTFFGLLSCVNEDLVFVTSGNHLLKSENGGNSWETIPNFPYDTNYTPFYSKIQFINENVGFTGLDFWRTNYEQSFEFKFTTNGGVTWNSSNGYAPFYFINENIGFYYFDGLFKSIDGGQSFQYFGTNEDMSWTFREIHAINENIVWGIRYAELLNYDTSSYGIIKVDMTNGDYMETIWEEYYPFIDMQAIHFADENVGYIVGSYGDRGQIWKNSTGINEMATQEVDYNPILSVYPNPTTSYFLIDSKDEIQSVHIMNTEGKLIKSFSNGLTEYSIQELDKAVYFVEVFTKKGKSSFKLIKE